MSVTQQSSVPFIALMRQDTLYVVSEMDPVSWAHMLTSEWLPLVIRYAANFTSKHSPSLNETHTAQFRYTESQIFIMIFVL